MRNFLVSVIVLGLLSLPMMAQDHSKVEVFGGYQYSHFGNDFKPVSDANGWDAAATFKFNRTLGVTADFTGAYHTISAGSIGFPVNVPVRLYTYTFGPEASFKVGSLRPFVHVLLGGAHVSASISGGTSPSINGFTEMMGGGADFKVNKFLSLRLIQADWVYYHFNSSSNFISSGISSAGNAKIATGVVVHF
jgi:hypothetical protein